jgi:hypothetical protein
MNVCKICNYQGQFIEHRNIKDRKCPKCFSLPRHRNLYDYLCKIDISDMDILHIAPEKCLMDILSYKSKTYTCLDKNISISSNDITFYKIDILDIDTICNKKFDCVICFHVLEHIEQDIQVIEKICDKMTSGGILLLSVPIKKGNTDVWTIEKINSHIELGIWGLPGKYNGHYRTYGSTDLYNILSKFFENVNISSDPITSEGFFICTKK